MTKEERITVIMMTAALILLFIAGQMIAEGTGCAYAYGICMNII